MPLYPIPAARVGARRLPENRNPDSAPILPNAVTPGLEAAPGLLDLGDVGVGEQHSGSQESVDVRLSHIAAGQYGLITQAQAEAVGATKGLIRHRIETRRWEQAHPKVYRMAGSPCTWRQNLLSACLTHGPQAVASHRAAAALLRLGGVDPGTIEITVPRGNRHRPIPGIRVHSIEELDAPDIAVVDCIPVTSAARTLIDLGAVLPASTVETALSDAIRGGLVSYRRMLWRLDEVGRQGRPGIAVIRRILEDDGTMGMTESELEEQLLRLMMKAGLPAPVCQHQVRKGGRVIARVDFAYPDERLGIEADGFRWHWGLAKWERDRRRSNDLTALGWRVLHITWRDVIRRKRETTRRILEFLATYGLHSNTSATKNRRNRKMG